MKELAGGLGVVLVLTIGLVMATGWTSEKASRLEYAKGQAQALVISAEAQASLSRAEAAMIRAEAVTTEVMARAEAAKMGILARTEATQLLMMSGIPWAVLFVVSLLGLCVMGLLALAIVRRPVVVHAPPQIIERQIIYLPRPETPRMEILKALDHRNDRREGKQQ